MSSQIFRYSFATLLIEDEIDHETVDSSIITSSGPSQSPRVAYDFVLIPTESSSSESSEFNVMIQQLVSSRVHSLSRVVSGTELAATKSRVDSADCEGVRMTGADSVVTRPSHEMTWLESIESRASYPRAGKKSL